jgi:hypothetical protein
MLIANPFLEVTEFRTSGSSHYRHGGSTVSLGVGSNRTFAGIMSSAEINFSETANGRSTRGSIAISRFYVVKQELVEEKQWHGTPTSAGAVRWRLHATRTNLPDDPDAALVTFQGSPPVVSFLDSPGCPITHLAGLPSTVTRVCAVQNFRLYAVIAASRSHGTFQAASDFLWHHLLCLERTQSRWDTNRSNSLLGRGQLRLAAPLWP